MDDDQEAYLLLLLSDSNLPTGSFVASAGLESYITHGLFSPSARGLQGTMDATMDFLRDSLRTYARSALPFVSDAHRAVESMLAAPSSSGQDDASSTAVAKIKALDDLYEAMTLNHVARRASKSQGVALLTLYSKGFSRPAFMQARTPDDSDTLRQTQAGLFIDRLKLEVRREHTHGHLPTCWGILTAALGLSLGMYAYTETHPPRRSLIYPRTKPVPSSLPPCPKFAVSICPPQYAGTVCGSAIAFARRTANGGKRSDSLQGPQDWL